MSESKIAQDMNMDGALFSYQPPLGFYQLLKSERAEIYETFGCDWKDTMIFVVEELEEFVKLLRAAPEQTGERRFSIQNNSWSLSPGQNYYLPEEDILICKKHYGFITKKSDFEKVSHFLRTVKISKSNFEGQKLNKVFWDSKTDTLRKDVEFFAKSKSWFDKRELPYARSYLLYGAPGNGKTSAIRAICDYFSVKPSTYSFSAQSRDPDSDFNSWVVGTREQELHDYLNFPTPVEEDSGTKLRVLLLEDVDRFFGNKQESVKTSVSLSAILNALDGVYNRKNSILIATANNPEQIDTEVLFRPGRFDLRVPFESPNKDSIFKFLKNLTKEDAVSDEKILDLANSCSGHSFAFIKGVYMSAASKAFARSSLIISDQDMDDSAVEMLSNLGKEIKSTVKRNTGF
jgi:hypothetical protein